MRQRRFDRFFTDPGGIFLRWSSALEKRFLPSSAWSSDMLTFWRERILFVTCFIAAVLGPVALIPSLILAYVEGRWEVIILDVFAYGMAVVILLGRRIPLNIRAWLICLVPYVLGVGLLFMLGSEGAGYLWLFGTSVMVGMLIGLRASFFALAMNFVALSAVALFVAFGQPEWIVDRTNAVQLWLVMLLNFILLNTFVTVTTAMMLSGLQKALSKELETSKSLMQSEERFRAAFRTSPDSIAISGLSDGRYVDINEGFTTMLGYDRDAVIGRTFGELMVWNDPKERHALVQELKVKGVVNNMAVRLVAKGGIVKTGLMSASLFDYHGAPHVLSITRDVTALKATEQQLRQARKMETIGNLAAGVAHDLNNILSGLVTYPDMLLMDLPENSELRKFLLIIKQSGEKAAAVVQDMLTLSRQGMAEKKVINLNKTIYDYLHSPEYRQLRANLPQVRLEIDLQEQLLNINGSPVQLSRTLTNLLNNAFEANLVDGAVKISTRNGYLDQPREGYERISEGEYVILTVSDTGIGIDAEDLSKIFEPFFTKKKLGRSGTGLGMTLIWSAVKDHGGFLDIRSAKGRGSTFEIYLPATRQEVSTKEPLFTLEDCRGTESVLVVDDIPEQREIAAMMLRKLGYTVLAVASGEAAVEYLQDKKADILVLDMIMAPGIDGCETYSRIIKDHPGQKAIIASGFSESERVKEAQRLGAGEYIKKPYTMDKVARALRTELDR